MSLSALRGKEKQVQKSEKKVSDQREFGREVAEQNGKTELPWQHRHTQGYLRADLRFPIPSKRIDR